MSHCSKINIAIKFIFGLQMSNIGITTYLAFKDDLIASFVYNPIQRLIPCDNSTNNIDCSIMHASQLLLSEIVYNIGRQ